MSKVARGTGIGAALWMVSTYLGAGGLERLADKTDTNFGRWSRAWEVNSDLELGAAGGIAAAAAVGGAFGAGCVVAVERIPLPRWVSGGLSVFAPGPPRRRLARLAPTPSSASWRFTPAPGYAALFAAHGAAVGLLT